MYLLPKIILIVHDANIHKLHLYPFPLITKTKITKMIEIKDVSLRSIKSRNKAFPIKGAIIRSPINTQPPSLKSLTNRNTCVFES